jgi:hypothetical protein
MFEKDERRRVCRRPGNWDAGYADSGLQGLANIKRERGLLRMPSYYDSGADRDSSQQNAKRNDGADNAYVEFRNPLHRSVAR